MGRSARHGTARRYAHAAWRCKRKPRRVRKLPSGRQWRWPLVAAGSTAATAAARPRSARACRGCSATSAPRARPVPQRSTIAVLRLRKQRPRYAPCSRFSPRRLPLGGARGHCLSSPQPSREPQRYAPSSPPAATRLPCAACGAAFKSPPSPPQGRYTPRYAVSAAVGRPVNAAGRPGCPRLVLGCQQRLLPRGAAQRAVATLWAPCFGPIRPEGHKVCSRLRPLHGFFQCFRPGRGGV